MKRKRINHFAASILLGVALLLNSQAQQLATQGQVEGFLLPLYDRENQLQAKIFGSRALFPDENKITIYDFKAEIYEKSNLLCTITSAEALFHKDEKRFETLAPVIVEHDKMLIQSRLLQWDMTEKKARFQEEVTVKLYLAPTIENK